jgi:nitrogen regulatory protein PII
LKKVEAIIRPTKFEDLKAALKRIEEKDIPVDIVFEQGLEVLGL